MPNHYEINRRSFIASSTALATTATSNIFAGAPSYHTPVAQHWQVGVMVTAASGPCAGVYATASVPVSWPEQTVKLAKKSFSPHVTQFKFREGAGGLKQMLIFIPRINTSQTASALLTFEIAKKIVDLPENPETMTISPTMPRSVRVHLAPSPMIESRHATIKSKAIELTTGIDSVWKKVETLYDFVRTEIDYQEGPIRGAVKTLESMTGEKEDLSSLFIAMCRSLMIPARTVWVPDHNYAEFYLQDAPGRGYWFPCQLAGGREFGQINDHRPILMRGDNFKVPEKPTAQRYVAEHLKVTQAAGRPNVQFVRQLSAA